MKLKLFLSVTGFLFILLSSQSQVLIEGLVLDSLSKEPISYANVIIKGSQRGASSDEIGRFELTVPALPCNLIVSTLGHEAKSVLITENNPTIYLKTLITQIGEAVVDDSPYQEILGDPMQTVLDFGFYDDKIVVLVRKFGKDGGKRIELLSDKGTSIASIPVDSKAEALYTDCMKFVHVLLPDSVYQIYYDYEKLQLLYPEKRNRFHFMMDRCEVSLGNELYFRQPAYRGIQMKYIRAINGQMSEFHAIEDSLKMEYIRRKFDLDYYLACRKSQDPRVQMPVDMIKANLDILRMSEQLDWADSKILSQAYAPIQSLNGEIVILDFSSDRLVHFNRELLVNRIKPISFHKEANWGKTILKDSVTEQLYTLYEIGAETEVAKIDSETLKVSKRTKLPGKGYLKGLKIRNSVVWFVDKDLDQPGIYRLFNFNLN